MLLGTWAPACSEEAPAGRKEHHRKTDDLEVLCYSVLVGGEVLFPDSLKPLRRPADYRLVVGFSPLGGR